MNVRTIAFTVFLMTMLMNPSDAQARIYKTVDKDGNVVFTDVPPKDNSKAIEIDAGNVYTTPTAVTPTRTGSEQDKIDDEEAEEPIAAYSRLQIVTPENDQAVRENAGDLNVVVSLSPTLNANHQIQLLLDGIMLTTLATEAGTDFQLSNVDRGTHVLTAQVVDTNGNTLITSDPTSFHMQRISVNSPARAKPRPRPAP